MKPTMKPLHGMLRTLAFGALAALGVVAWQFLLMRWLGAATSFSLYALICCCAFPLAIAPTLRAALGALVLAVPLAGAVLVLTPDATATLLGCALIVALTRALMFRAHLGRSVALEVVLFVLALGAARLFGGGTPFGLALGMWSYFLVQSCYFLCLGPHQHDPEMVADAFDLAHQRALALLERRA
jgi:hypothetical protein